MKTPGTRKREKTRKAFHVAKCGRETVSVYRRIAPNGSPCFMVANYTKRVNGKKVRRFDSYANEADAIDAANKLARQMSEGEVLAAAMTNEQASEFANAVQKLQAFGIGLVSAADGVAEALKTLGGFADPEKFKLAAARGEKVPSLADLQAACVFYRERHKKTTAKRVADVVAELLTVKKTEEASERYLQDLRSRLNRFAEAFQKNIGDVTTPDVRSWVDGQKELSPQTRRNFRRVINCLFVFAVESGYALDNPLDGFGKRKGKAKRSMANRGDVAIFTPQEISRLLQAASPDFLPSLAIGAFAGLRSAEIERLDWAHVDLAGRHITVGADVSKTASRRTVPICDALAAWLQPYAGSKGKLWKQGHEDFYEAQQATAAATTVEADAEKGIAAQKAVKWKANALRHSFISYRLAETKSAAQVSLEAGNSPSVVFGHYNELATPSAASAWFAVSPKQPVNVLPMPAAAAATP